MTLKTYLLSVGTENVAVATSSKRAAVAALNAVHHNWSLYAFNIYASTLRDDHEIAVMALAQPGTVFAQSNRRFGEPWKALTPKA